MARFGSYLYNYWHHNNNYNIIDQDENGVLTSRSGDIEKK